MSYTSSEQSVSDGRPTELHHIWDELGNHYRIASGPADVNYNSYLYTPEPAKRSELKLTDNHKKNEMTLELSRDNSFAQRFLGGPIDVKAYWQIYRGHGTDFVPWWFGEIKQVTFDGDGVPTATATPRSSSITKAGKRHVCQRLCDHALYDAWCGVNREDYRVDGTISDIDGKEITSTAFGNPPAYSSRDDLTSLPGCTYNASSVWNVAVLADWAFDNQLPPGHWWTAASNSNEWVSCHWTSAQTIRVVSIQPCHGVGYSQYNPRHVKIEGSNNGSTWYKVPIIGWLGRCAAYNTDEAELEQIDDTAQFVHLRLNNSTAYTYYRVYCYDNWGGADYVAIGEIEMRDYDPELSSPLSGGMIIVNGARRIITAHSGDTVTLNRAISGAQISDALVAYPGCDHTPLTCESKFDKKINYGGDEHLLTKNPFAGDALV